jgi:hypothetical protein
VDPREYDWQMGDLAADPYMGPDERYMQPPPRDAAWPQQFLPSPGDPAKWQAPPTALARWPVDPSQMSANEAAAFQTQSRYRNPLSRDPASNQMGALAEMVAPQSPLDYALLGAGPIAKAASVPVRAALYGGAMALDPGKAEAMLAGKNSRTANLALYKKAEEMLLGGRKGPEIRKETNWFPIDTRGNLAYEISDKSSGWLPGQDPSKIPMSAFTTPSGEHAVMQGPAGRTYNHPAAYEAYPDLATTPLIIDPRQGKGVQGGFLPPEYVGDQPKAYLTPASSGQMRSVLMHELFGHGVQNLEQGQTPAGKLTGWSIGGNPNLLLRDMKEGTPQYELYQRMLADVKKPDLSFREYADMLKGTGLPATEKSYKNFLENTKFGVTDKVDERLRQLAAHATYRRGSGEEMARAIQARMNFGPRKIQQVPFGWSMDTPIEQQIFIPRPPLKQRPVQGVDQPPDQISSLADQSRLQLEAKAPTGFVPGSVLSPEARQALPKNWRDLPGENAPFPQYAEQYPPVGPPTMVPKDKPKFPGETYPEKTLTPEGEEFVKARNKIMADMKKTPYEPYYDPAKRYDVDPSNYPPANVDTLTVQPKKAKTLEEYEKVIDTPETRKALRDAYERGQNLGDTANWYAMGQLEADYIKELGEKAGRKAFLEEYAVPTAATTSGNKPINNLLMGHYFEFLRKKGEPIPEGHQFPAPIGGRRANVNVRDYESVMEGGGYSALGYEQPKMHNFSRSFIGDLSRGVMDEQMAGGALAHAPDKAFVDKARTTGFGLLEKQMHTEAKRAGVKPGNFQDVAWAGFKDEAGRPMITEINDTIERTHRLTGMPRSEIVRRGFIKKEIPLYGAGGVVMGGLAAQDEYQ